MIWARFGRCFNDPWTQFRIRSGGVCRMDWVMQNTAYSHRFDALYKRYMQVAAR